MSFTSDFIQLNDPKAMRALAHPVRLKLLTHMLQVETTTATECADAIGESPSSCSYHLRTLAEHGFIAEQNSTDGREHRWKLLVRGFDISSDTPEQRAAGEVLLEQLKRQDDEIVNQYLRQKDQFSDEWRQAVIFARSGLHLTSAELELLQEQYLALLTPYITRESAHDWPKDAERVRILLRAVPWPSDPVN